MAKCFLFTTFAILSLFVPMESSTFDATQNESVIETPVRYVGDQLWSVEIPPDQDIGVLMSLTERLGLTIWNRNHTVADVFVKKSALDQYREVLEDNKIHYSIQIEDLQNLIELEAQPFDGNARRNSDHPLTWIAYHSTDDIYKFLNYLVEKYPELCSLQIIGHTFENRPLKVLKISNGKTGNKAIWIDGGIHAREWISSASVTYIVNDLVVNWNSQPDHIKNVNWYVLPVHNPDGYEYSRNSERLWRKNRSKQSRCAGVDLNRNFGYKWGEQGTSGDPCSDIYRGSEAFSELESSAVKKFFENSMEKNFKAFLTFHSYGQFILYPWGYSDLEFTPDHEDLARAGKKAAKKMKQLDNEVYTAGHSATLLYPAAGGSDDWGKSIGIKYSYTIELRDRGGYAFVLPPQFILATAKEARAFVHTIAEVIAQSK